MILRSLLLLVLFSRPLVAELALGGYECDLSRDLMIVEWVNQHNSDHVPVYYNHLLQGGYLNMPSSRMGKQGEVGVGVSFVPPYHNYNLRFQLLSHVELSGNYRVFEGIEDPNLSKHGFGDFSDKGANIKVACWFPEDSGYLIPGLAFGWEDFIGTKAFEARYAVLTQVFPKWNLEASLGYGDMRLNGWFGGITWIPFRKSCNPYIKDFSLVAEYDAIPYSSIKIEPHPEGRTKKTPINFGFKYRLGDMFDLSCSYVRGDKLALSLSTYYNWGMTNGIVPKIDDPLPYRCPVNTQAIGPLRPCDVMVQDLFYAFEKQGFCLMETWLSTDRCSQKILRLQLVNTKWRYETDVRVRINDLLAYLIPEDIDQVVVLIESEGVEMQEYHYQMPFVRMYAEKRMCPYELYVLSPLCDVVNHDEDKETLIFKQHRSTYDFDIYPMTYTAFGSAKGKFKYLLGLHVGVEGYLWNEWNYHVLLGYSFISDLYDVSDVDKLNPSQLINVRTDSVNYFKQEGLMVNHAYLERTWNMGYGSFFRFSLGLFEEAYGGVAGEFLYYPVKSCWAFGLEGAYLRKRTYEGIGFTDKVRKLVGYQPTYIEPFHPSQYFLNFYYNFNAVDMDLVLKGGKFLADDWGVRTEISRYFPSGMRCYFWYTCTNGKDYVNGHRYYDKGVGFSMPLDIFLTCSSRDRWGYGMSAWLRDVGAQAYTGDSLYWKIRDQREKRCLY